MSNLNLNTSLTEDVACQLGLPGAPAAVDALTPGGAYALHVETLPARLGLIIEALRTNLSKGLTATLVTPLPLNELLARARELGADILDSAARRGQLKLFASIGDYTKNIFRFGPQRFLAELEQHGVSHGQFVVIDHADNLFTLHDAALVLEQAKAYHQWLRDRGHTGLFLFLRSQSDDTTLSEQHGLLSYMSGCARLAPVRERLELDVHFWHSPLGAVMGLALPLSFDRQGRLMAATAAGASAASTAPAPTATAHDEDDVYYMGTDLTELAHAQKRGRWIHVESLIGMLHATREAQAATLLLRFGSDINLQQLAEAVHTLRLNLGARMRIVIRETNASLRYPNELLLLRIGANRIVHRDSPLARLPLALESLHGQIFARALDVPFKDALSSVAAGSLHGQVAGPLFCQEVGEALRRAAVLGVPYTLVVARRRADRKLEEIAEQFRINRSGDVLTLHGDNCVLFLQACPGESAPATLERLVAAPLDTLFADVQYHHTEPTIQKELEKLNLCLLPASVTPLAAAARAKRISQPENGSQTDSPGASPQPGRSTSNRDTRAA